MTQDRAWRAATDAPLEVAKISQALLAQVASVGHVCRPSVLTDLEIGKELLAVGVQAGLCAAEANLRQWGDPAAGTDLRLQIERLKQH
jgi:formiminotetrahydrofolate cyclodeaminase